jgi:subtilisin family serine protease
VSRWRVVLAVVIGSGALAPPATATGGVIVRSVVSLRPGAGDPDVLAAQEAQALRFSVLHVYHAALRGFAADLTGVARAALLADPRVLSIETDRVVTAAGQVIPTGVRRVHGDLSPTAAVGRGRSPVGVNVAILDTGIDAHHPDLDVAGGANCTGGAGYDDRYGHGTHIAGIVGALDNSIGVVGVAPGARLWAVKVLDDHGDGSVSELLCGIDWVASTRSRRDPAERIAVANLSEGGTGSDDGHCGQVDGDLVHQAVCRSVAAGVTYVAAAGNDHADASTVIPAAYSEVITVSALADSDGKPGRAGGRPSCRSGEEDDTLASFSNFGPAVDLIAPGVCILSTMPTHGTALGDHDGYGVLTGTSFAAPHVAGAAALWISRHPGASPADVRTALIRAGNYDWDNSNDPDGIKEPLVDVSTF